MARVRYATAKMNFALPQDATLERLKARSVEWMEQGGHGADWTIDGEDNEPIDFEFEYEIIPLVPVVPEVPIRIFLKQLELQIMPSIPLTLLSDQIVERIYPNDGSVDNRDAEDFSYTFDWQADHQYWFDVVYDPAKDRASQAKAVWMLDPNNRAESFVVPISADINEVRDLWKRVMEVPAEVQVHMQTSNGHLFSWSLESAIDLTPYTLKAANFHGNACVYAGTNHFVADQLGRKLDLKIPPFALCQVVPRRGLGPR
jgi:hypothetical protein